MRLFDIAARYPRYRYCVGQGPLKTILIMKLIIVFFLAGTLGAGARSYSQNVTLNFKGVSFDQILREIKRQTGYMFLYDNQEVKKVGKVSVNVKDATVQEALAQALTPTTYTYKIVENTIVLMLKPQELKSADQPLPPIAVKGRIVDSLGSPIAAVNVNVKGSRQNAVTDDDGNFEFKSIDSKSVLIITCVGYKTQELPVNNKGFVPVVLRQKVGELSEVNVVATGYQRVQKYQLTGAVSVLTEKSYDQRVAITGNFLESLEGKIPGLVYNSQSGELSIRGVSTFSAVKQPLIIVDGFPTEIDLRTINPNEIISVSVLKDAAAAAIYGVRASNGVIVLETRRGKSGKAVLNLRASSAIQGSPDFDYLKYASASEYAQLEASLTNAGTSPSLLSFYSSSGYPLTPVQTIILNKFNGTITADQANQQLATIGSYDNLKEYENLFYQNRQTNNVNLDVSGGTEKSTYMLGLNYITDKLVNRRSKNQQYILNMANTYQLNSRMRFDFKGTYTNSENVSGNTPGYSTFFPYEHLADDYGNALPVTFGVISGASRSNSINAINVANNTAIMAAGLYDKRYYPYRELDANTNTFKTSSVRFQGRLNVKITNWLNMDIGGNYENQDMRTDVLNREDALNTRLLLDISALKDAATGRAVYSNVPQGDILKRTSQKTINYTLRGQLNLNKNFGNNKHNISGIFGIEQRKTVVDAFTTSYFGYDGQTLISKPINMIAFNALGTSNAAFTNLGTVIIPHNSTTYFNQTNRDNRFMSYYGNATYVFAGKYIATGSVRLDQSNLFGADPKYRNKPLGSGGLAWRINKEDFMSNFSWLDDLKMRVSTGFTGNIPSSNNGKFLLLSSALNTTLAIPQAYYSVTSPQNESLRWETTRNYNIGLDYELFNRLSGTIDYYIKKSVDVFGAFGADPTSGFNSYNSNTASILNKGLELMVNSTNIQGRHIQWNTQLTASFNHNEVIAVKETPYSTSTGYVSSVKSVVGKPIDGLFSYNYGGLTKLGQPFVLNAKGEQKILNGSSIDVTQSDLIYDGTTTPKYVLGLNNQIGIGAFDISFLFMYYGGHVIRVEAPSPNTIFNPTPLQGSSNYWKKPGDELTTLIPALPLGSASAVGYYSAFGAYGYYYASQFVRKADYIRLRDVVVTYNIKGNVVRKMRLQQPQLRFQAQNAFRYTFSGNDIDPEAVIRSSGTRVLPIRPMYSLSFYTKF